MKNLFLILFIFCSFGLFATDTVRISDPANLQILGIGAGVYLGSDSPTTDATTEAAPAKVYIPIKSATNVNYSLLANLYDVGNSTQVVTYPLLLTVGGTAKYIYAAVKYADLGADFYVVAKSASTFSDKSNELTYFSLAPATLCTLLTSHGNSACTNLSTISTTDSNIVSTIYFFLSDENLDTSGGTSINPATPAYAGGVYFQAQLSNRVYTASELTTTISSLRSGDARVIIDYNSSTEMTAALFKQVVIFNYSDTSVEKSGNPTFQTLLGLGTVYYKDVLGRQSGQLNFNELINGTTYNVSIALVDKFLFVTTFSDSKIGTPLKIEELLKKQACFLLTAGFGEEHFIINFFRGYRDQVLAYSWLGKKFIKSYYALAPHYAMILYKSEAMRWGVRMIAYGLYFFFNYCWLVLLIFGFIFNIRHSKSLERFRQVFINE